MGQIVIRRKSIVTMRAWVLDEGFGIERLRRVERPMPEPGQGQVLVRITAASLNFRDLLMVQGIYNPRQALPIVPGSDAAGVVTAVGSGVAGLAPGDRVVAAFFPDWPAGRPSAVLLGHSFGAFGHDGVLADYRLFEARGLLRVPDAMTDAEAACLPCAGVTAWSAVVKFGRTQPGDTLLVQGTGGVALFALQFAKAAGARVIVTSSSDEKLARARELGADFGINYRTTPDWGKAAVAWARGIDPAAEGLDHIVELGGADTLDRSIRAIRVGGTLSLIGVLGGPQPRINLPLVVMRQVRLQGVTVGSVEDLRAMLAGMAAGGIRPAIDRSFAMDAVPQAFAHMATGGHFGKIVVTA